MPSLNDVWEELVAASDSLSGGPLSINTIKPRKEKEMIIEAPEGFTFGCDPEAFVFNAEGKPVPPDMIPGTKSEPYPVKCGAVQRDGMAAEFNIEPASTFRDFNHNIETVIEELKKFLPEGHTLQFVPAVTFDPEVFEAASDEAKELGCMPDVNAWTGDINPPPSDPDNPYMRCAAGHIHLGWTNGATLDDAQHIMNCQDIVKQLDWYLGGWSISMDSDPTRRRLYGRAGACRYKPYGVEYRVLSNFWVTTRDRRLAVWNRMQTAIKDMQKSFLPEMVNTDYSEQLVAAINETKKNPSLSQVFRYPLSTLDRTYKAY